MNAPIQADFKPFFLEGSQGKLFAVEFPVPADVEERGRILKIQPFAEEMNRCRAMVALQARSFAKAGFTTLVLDPLGTGDSAGDFADFHWERWKEDILAGAAWLKTQRRPPTILWGTRLGALLAFELACVDDTVERLLLWQPVIDGERYLTQFLRIRVAAELGDNARRSTTKEFRNCFANGEAVPVSGYDLSPTLGRELDQKKIGSLSVKAGVSVEWFEILSTETAAVPKAHSRAIERLRDDGTNVRLHQVRGPAFWQLHERTLVPELLASSVASLDDVVS